MLIGSVGTQLAANRTLRGSGSRTGRFTSSSVTNPKGACSIRIIEEMVEHLDKEISKIEESKRTSPCDWLVLLIAISLISALSVVGLTVLGVI